MVRARAVCSPEGEYWGLNESVANSFMKEANLRWNLKKWIKWLWLPLNKEFWSNKTYCWKKTKNPSTRYMSWDHGGKMTKIKKCGLGRGYKGAVLLTASPP